MLPFAAFLSVCGLLIGATLGNFLPEYSTWWCALIVIVISVIVAETIGNWGFGHHWATYWPSVYILYVVPVICLCFGAFLGAGKIGTLLVTIGTAISR